MYDLMPTTPCAAFTGLNGLQYAAALLYSMFLFLLLLVYCTLKLFPPLGCFCSVPECIWSWLLLQKQLGRFYHWMASLKLSPFLWMSIHNLIFRGFQVGII